MTSSFPPPPVFSYNGAPNQGIVQPGIFSLVDVFDDFLFNPNDPFQPNMFPPQPPLSGSNQEFDEYLDEDSGERGNTDEESGKPRKRIRSSIRELPMEQQYERR